MMKSYQNGIKLLATITILFLFITGCNTAQIVETKQISLTTVLGSGLNDISQIYVRYGDGKELTIVENEYLQKTTNILKGMQVIHVESMPDSVGQLYTLKIKDGSQIIEYSSSLFLNGKQYKVVNDVAKKDLDQYLIKIGRAVIPDLLPGIEIKQKAAMQKIAVVTDFDGTLMEQVDKLIESVHLRDGARDFIDFCQQKDVSVTVGISCCL